jgi:hypothetical protein
MDQFLGPLNGRPLAAAVNSLLERMRLGDGRFTLVYHEGKLVTVEVTSIYRFQPGVNLFEQWSPQSAPFDQMWLYPAFMGTCLESWLRPLQRQFGRLEFLVAKNQVRGCRSLLERQLDPLQQDLRRLDPPAQ